MAELEIRPCGSRKEELHRKEMYLSYLMMAYTIILLILVYLIAQKKKG